MDANGFGRNATRTFVASTPGSTRTADRSASPTTFVPAPRRVLDPKRWDLRQERRAFALLIIAAIALVVLPELITHLLVKHSPDLPPGEDTASSKLPIAHLASLGGSAALLALSGAIAVRRGRPDRNITGVLVLLIALNVPYFITMALPSPQDLIKLALSNAFILAIWNVGAPIAELKWLPIIVTGIGVYSLIGGFLAPDYMMYNTKSTKAIVGGWELAGPFGHGNVLGVYCGLAFALVPLIPKMPWRIFCAVVLVATIVASATRTALICTAAVAIWWLVSWLKSVISVRTAGTVFVAVVATATFTFPFLAWDPHAFSDRASVWASALKIWEQSPLVGMGVNWFLTGAQASANIASWAYVGTGHNLTVDNLVKSGLLGVAVLVPVLAAAVWSTRGLTVSSQQIACFGYLIAFFVVATTEAVWSLMPNLQLFPISGMVFAALAVTPSGGQATEGSS
ncbi:O-antigen ligase family protein [Mycobacterium crocinum]|uniref:O-antigen ligase family protein n=1 Tax=Mycolicibacterium crocinum TaxID=388459 RepID=A0ABY3TR92_9MYCO|nr:O-antigen ligase family protein [Mycolicibacterium crocinum]MCV7217315.1 O-antigen ligase family protein [Mycolicibacterium crocinum]ULN42214.1 O-antigen ligase family protein [Mycolicibacterium crocinum]